MELAVPAFCEAGAPYRWRLRLLGLDVTKLNDLALTYGKFNFKRGWFDLVLETDSKEGQMTGYVKPLFRNLRVFSLTQDIKEDSVLQFFWQALVGTATGVNVKPTRWPSGPRRRRRSCRRIARRRRASRRGRARL